MSDLSVAKCDIEKDDIYIEVEDKSLRITVTLTTINIID